MEVMLATILGVAVCMATIVLVLGAALLRATRYQAMQNGLRDPEFFIPCNGAVPPKSSGQEFVQPEPDTSLLDRIMHKDRIVLEDPNPADLTDKSYLGKINFGVSYDKDSKNVSVHVIQATNLQGQDLTGSADPYVRVCLLPDTNSAKVTRVQKRSLNPKFNQTLTFSCLSTKKLEELTLCLQVLDYDRFKWDDPIGEILLPMKHVKTSNCPVFWKNLNKVTVRKEGKGEVLLSLCYAPDYSRLNVVVQKARGLPAKDSNGSSDPYIKIWMVEDSVKTQKKKTSVRTCTLNPIFNESFNFDVSKDKIDHVQLMITAMDYDVVTKNDEMGYIVLGLSGTESGRKHWKEMLDHQGYPTTVWHRLSPPKW